MPTHIYTAILLGLLLACGRHSPKADTRTPLGDLQDKQASILDEIRAGLDPITRWPTLEDCDGLLWASLTAAIGLDVDLAQAEDAPGHLQRRPGKPCWSIQGGDQGSKSTISNDMILGYLWAAWRRHDLGMVQRLADYGSSHDWVMGAPFPAEAPRVVLKPNQVGLLGRIIYALGGADAAYRYTPPVYYAVAEDYERHLQALGLALQGEVDSAIRHDSGLIDLNDQMLDRVGDLVAAEPENPLYAALAGVYSGDQSRAVTLLLDPGNPVPTYVRGAHADLLAKVEWAFAASLVSRGTEP